MNYCRYWTKVIDRNGIVWLGLDCKDSSVNVINDSVLDELYELLQSLSEVHFLTGLVIYSLKPNGFIAGADIRALSQLETMSQVRGFVNKGQTVFLQLERMRIPTVAMIDGFCLGGGLELALACDYRIATDDPGTQLGLPEVKLGIHPCWGGTVRLPKRIGGYNALRYYLLSGRTHSAANAYSFGLVDKVVPKRLLEGTVVNYVLKRPAIRKPRWLSFMTNYRWIRPLIASILRRQLAKKVNQVHYPAPFAIIEQWKKAITSDDLAYFDEANSIQRLLTNSDTPRHLMRVFLLQERLKQLAKQSDSCVQRVHIIGAGVMGGDIAAWCALRGFHVTLQDISAERVNKAMVRAHAFIANYLPTSQRVPDVIKRLISDVDGHEIQRADVIIEAVSEEVLLKQTIIQYIEALAKPEAIIASNTSSIGLDKINQLMVARQRLIGLHFFNPVAKMKLVEVVVGSQTGSNIVKQAFAFVGEIGRLPLPVKDGPGFLINRVLMPYLLEALALLDEGFAIEVIDKAAKSFGMLMGPFELADTVGLDICLAVIDNLSKKSVLRLRELVLQGTLGRKTNHGFYRYKDGKLINQHKDIGSYSDSLSHRLISKMIDEANACLHDKVVLDADLLDAAMIFGAGFPAFRGGLMQYAIKDSNK